jgi:hypothetical protein
MVRIRRRPQARGELNKKVDLPSKPNVGHARSVRNSHVAHGTPSAATEFVHINNIAIAFLIARRIIFEIRASILRAHQNYLQPWRVEPAWNRRRPKVEAKQIIRKKLRTDMELR